MMVVALLIVGIVTASLVERPFKVMFNPAIKPLATTLQGASFCPQIPQFLMSICFFPFSRGKIQLGGN